MYFYTAETQIDGDPLHDWRRRALLLRFPIPWKFAPLQRLLWPHWCIPPSLACHDIFGHVLLVLPRVSNLLQNLPKWQLLKPLASHVWHEVLDHKEQHGLQQAPVNLIWKYEWLKSKVIHFMIGSMEPCFYLCRFHENLLHLHGCFYLIVASSHFWHVMIFLRVFHWYYQESLAYLKTFRNDTCSSH